MAQLNSNSKNGTRKILAICFLLQGPQSFHQSIIIIIIIVVVTESIMPEYTRYEVEIAHVLCHLSRHIVHRNLLQKIDMAYAFIRHGLPVPVAYKGCYYDPTTSLYKVYINHGRHKLNAGCFRDKIVAAVVVDYLKTKHGIKGLNFPFLFRYTLSLFFFLFPYKMYFLVLALFSILILSGVVQIAGRHLLGDDHFETVIGPWNRSGPTTAVDTVDLAAGIEHIRKSFDARRRFQRQTATFLPADFETFRRRSKLMHDIKKYHTM